MAKYPSWLSEHFLRSCLNCSSDTDIEITRNEIEPAVPLGENYFSVILRVKVYYKKKPDCEEESITLITKSMPEGVLSDLLKNIKAMEKEISMYRSIVPPIERLTCVQVTPKSYCTDNDGTVIMEDLKIKGYKMADRIKQLDYQHCVMALKTLAKFQAASVVLHDANPDLFEIVGEETVYSNLEAQKCFVENAFKLLVDEVEQWPGAEDFAPRLKKVAVDIFEKVGEAVKPSCSGINVLNHGDFWGNNILYYYDKEGNIVDVRLIDWQMCRWTTPAMDLQMFFYSSVRDLKSVDKLKTVYLSAFNETLSSLGSKNILSYKQLEEDLQRTDCFGLMVAAALLPICIGTRGQHMDFSETTMDDYSAGFVKSNPYAHIYKGLKYKEIMPEILHLFRDKNIL